MIFDQLQEVQKQIDRLGQHLDERFDRIETQLAELYSMAAGKFDEILVELARADRKLSDIQKGLLQLQKRIDRLEANILGAINQWAEFDLDLDIRGAISYQQRTGDDITEAGFNRAAGVFASWALQGAYTQTVLAPTQGRPTISRRWRTTSKGQRRGFTSTRI